MQNSKVSAIDGINGRDNRRRFAARSPSAPGMEAFPGLEEGYIKKGRSHANLAGTGPGVCGGRKPS